MTHLAPLAALLLSALPAAAEPIDLTLEEFKMYQHYKNASEDPRVLAMKPASRLPAIAKDARFKLKDLEKAIARGEAAGDVKQKCEANIKGALLAGDLKDRLGKIEVDTSEPHAVAYVQWLNENPLVLSQEASYAAAVTGASCPIISTIQVWAQDKARPTVRVFQAIISGSAAAKIKPEKAKDFAETRYIRLFEKVKSVVAGDDMSAESGNPGGKSTK
ncbi:MAG: hypothetical protein ACYC8T_22075 [Myxococcaceae bacterium]